VAQGHSEAPSTIAAEQGPVKVAPTNPGGTPTPYTGLKIYQQPAPDDAGTDTAAPASAAAPAPKPAPVALVPATTVPTEPVSAPPTPAPVTTPAAQQIAATAPPKPIVAPKPIVKVVAPPPPAPKPSIAEAPAPAPAAAGGAMIQIGSYKSEAEANAAWTTYKAKHGSVIGSGSLDVAKVDLGAKGTWYRARIAGFASKAEAADTCTKLKADGADCIVAH
jgi:SPOR domain